MDIENLKGSLFKILSVWGVIFWVVGIGYMIYTSTELYMWFVMACVLILPILGLYFYSSKKVK